MSQHFVRLGPTPLPLHAFAAWRATTLALAASGGCGALDPALERRIAAAARDPASRRALAEAVLVETGRRWSGFWQGVAMYRTHPYRRRAVDRPTLWGAGESRLIDFAPESRGPPVLAVPSLVNSSDVLDLLPGRSLMRGLAEAGFRPFLVDWGRPDADAARWNVARYLDERLAPMRDAAAAAAGRPPILMGYCMGGLFTAALAARRPEATPALALLATPWDFHRPAPEPYRRLGALLDPFRAAAKASGAVPNALLQTLFLALDPTLAARKYRRFAELDQELDEAELFVAMEDWVNGGPDLALPVAETVLGDWYGRNDTAGGRWRVGGRLVTNRSYPGPTLVAAPARDRIVPPASARAYADGAADAAVLDVIGGHVGMIVGHDARRRLWKPLVEWLSAHSG